MDGERVYRQALTWIGTPWVHQGRIKGVGADCVGLIVGVAKELGIPVVDDIVYPRRPDGRLQENLKRQLVETTLVNRQIGDVGFFIILEEWEHVGIFGPETLVHIHHSHARCLEHILDKRWLKRCRGVYTWPN